MATAPHATCLPKSFFSFLRDLEANNSKPWFDKNRERYASDVQEPVRALVRHLAVAVPREFPYLVGSDAKSGGSMTRLHRDVRFSKDKRPFNSHVGLHFWHVDGRKMELPGLFLRLAADEVLLGTGLHQPEPPLLLRVRTSIASDSSAWRKASRASRFLKEWGGLEGESLKRVPAPWSTDHPEADDLRRKDFTAFLRWPAKSALQPGFADDVMSRWSASKPLMTFLVEACTRADPLPRRA